MNENLPLADIADVAEKLADSAKLTSHLELTKEQKQKLTGLTGSYKLIMMMMLRIVVRMSLYVQSYIIVD